MKRLLAAIGLVALVFAAHATSALAGDRVSFTQGTTKVNAYLALPKGEGTHPAVIVIQEWWGLNDWVEKQANKLADLGYIALAPDLYKGKVTKDQAVAHQLMNGLDEAEAMAMLRASADFLRGRSDVRANAIGTIGWCMGGGYAIRLATDDPGIRAVVMYYGAPLTDATAIRRVKAAVLGNFGGADKGPSPDQVSTFQQAMKKAGKRVDFKVYPSAGHAFANETNPFGTYKETYAKDAWTRTTAFFKKELKQASIPHSHG